MIKKERKTKKSFAEKAQKQKVFKNSKRLEKNIKNWLKIRKISGKTTFFL